MRDYRPSALISICGSLMRRRTPHKRRNRDFLEELGAWSERAIVHCPGSSRAKGGTDGRGERERGIQLMMSLWRKLNQRLPPSLGPSLSLRCLVLQVTLIVGRSAGRHRVQRCTGALGRGRCIAVMERVLLTASALGNSCISIHPVGQVLALLCPSSSSSIPPTFLPPSPTYYLPPGEQEEKRN